MKDIKSKFPIFNNLKSLIYLDNAATTQKPEVVISALKDFYKNYNSNVHRGLYPISEQATFEYENARKKVAKLINAEPEEIIFTSGTTDSINSISRGLYSSGLISKSPRILLSELEHHSNVVPWQMIPNSKIDYIKVNSNFQLDYDTMPDEEYDIASFTHISNVTGTRIDIEALKNTVRSRFLILDAAQSIAHTEIDVKKLNVDSMAFSGHKMFGPTGIGVLYVKKELGEKLNPFNFGGGMIREVEKVKSTWAPIPEKFEAGTPPIAQAIALGAAIDFINMIGFDLIEQHETELKNYALQKLKEIKEVQIFHEDQNPDAGAVISFTVGRTHSHDISQFLGDREVCVRAGHHCTQILHREILQVPASARLSLSIYNTKEDIDKFIEILKEAISFYQKKF